MSSAPQGSAAALASAADAYWRFLCHEFPLTAILAGEANDDPALFREAPEDHERRRASAARQLAALDALPVADLGPAERATHALLRHELGLVGTLHGAAAHLRPSLFPSGPAVWAAHFANTTTLADTPAAELYVERLATLPEQVRGLAACLAEGHARGHRYPRHALACAAGALRAAVAGPVEALPWCGPFTRSAVAARASVQRLAARAKQLLAVEIVPAYEALAARLEGPLAEGARESLACVDDLRGDELYRAAILKETSTALAPDEIHQLGRAEVQRLETEIRAVAAEAGYPGDVEGYRRRLAGPEFVCASGEALREQVEILAKRIDACIPLFFGRIPRITYGVQSMPEPMARRMPPAYAQAGPTDRSAPGICWVTCLPERFPSYLHLPLALHEAWPGHLMHIALMQESRGLPAFRRHGASRYTACVEGWALYCEALGVEMGLYRTPHQQYGRLESEIWRALRLVVDTGLHVHRWSRERAVEEMAAHMALPRPTIEAEVDRYIGWPAQALGYQLGGLAFRGARRRAEERLGERFDRRAFHDALLSAGAVSLPVLDQVVSDWAAAREATA